MSRIRVALGDVQAAMLRDILAQITGLEPDMELIGHLAQVDLKAAVADQKPDVLICDVPAHDLPEICRELFSEPDPPVVVGLAREGREAAVCIPNAGAAQLMAVVRSAVGHLVESPRVIELGRPSDGERAGEATDPYTSNADCLNDQLRVLDLALLAEVDLFESTTWDEGPQRLQGLAVSPEEVRALLDAGGTAAGPRQSGELKRRRQRMSEWTSKRLAATSGRADAPPFVRLIDRFHLDPFEQFCIIAALAIEIDRNKYGKAFALLQDDVTRKQPSWELLLRLYEGSSDSARWDAARAFDAGRPLRRWSLIRLAPRDAGEPAAPFGRRIELDDRMSRFLLGLDDLGPEMEEFAVVGGWEPEPWGVAITGELEGRLVQLVGDVVDGARGAPPRLVLHVYGRRGSGKRTLIAGICRRRGLRLLRVDPTRLAAMQHAQLEEALTLLARESALQPTAVCIEMIDPLIEDEALVSAAQALRTIARAVQTFSPVTFVTGQRPWMPEGLFTDGSFQSVFLDLPELAEARQIWASALRDAPLAPDTGGAETASGELAARFRLSPGQIHEAVAAAKTRALWDRPGSPALTLTDIYRGARDQSSPRLGSLARPVTTDFGWNDLILPDKPRDQLRELETAIRNATGVLQEWDFQSRLAYGRGITALFAGPSGTGKTMAAGILARELGLDLYKIDLSRVVSKYIGETEKNLDRIFQQAEDANAMLFFDEADALFGKRSAIKDAHDRYANIEIAYLLQKMEERLGVTILATNLQANMDEAFVRRIRFAIEFPMPEYAQRLDIWRRSLPAQLRLAEDVDLPLLARRLRISGGSIMNICLSAASLAYKPGGVVRMEHFARAAKRELQKLGRQFNEADFAPRELAGAAGPENGA